MISQMHQLYISDAEMARLEMQHAEVMARKAEREANDEVSSEAGR